MSVLRNMRRAAVKASVRHAATLPAELTPVPESEWPAGAEGGQLAVWRSRKFLVQAYTGGAGTVRLSVNRTKRGIDGRWLDGITWDELQTIKSKVGYADCWAVEVFPPADRVVDVANMRHLWLLTEAPVFAWRREG